MRHLFLLLLILFALMLTACSYAVEFVVINESDSPIEVQCRSVDLQGNPDSLTEEFSMTNASQLRAGDREWRKLSATEYRVELENQTVKVRVMPGEALLVKRFHDTSIKNGGPTYFPIEEITIVGASGEIKLRGRQVAKAFVLESDRLYVLAYK